jgi:hypothetical protein
LVEVSGFVFGVVRLVEVVRFVVFLSGAVFRSGVLALVRLEPVRELFESRRFFELSASRLFFELSASRRFFELSDFVFFAFCLESDFVLFAFCLESEFCLESFVCLSFVCFAEVFRSFRSDFDELCLDLSAVLFFDVVLSVDFDEETVLPFLSVDFFGTGVAFACVFLFGVGVFLAGVVFVFDAFRVCALSTESVVNTAKKMKKAMTNPVF